MPTAPRPLEEEPPQLGHFSLGERYAHYYRISFPPQDFQLSIPVIKFVLRKEWGVRWFAIRWCAIAKKAKVIRR